MIPLSYVYRSRNSDLLDLAVLYLLLMTLVAVLLTHRDEHRGKHREDIGLDEAYKHIKREHENGEEY